MKKYYLLLLAVIIACGAIADPVAPASFQDLPWRLVGPFRAGWSTCAEGVPDEPDTFYFGSADGGVWKTEDAGQTWRSISDSAPFSSVGALAIAPGNPRVIYVGSGQVETRYDIMEDSGMYKSEDDGQTWVSLGLAATLHIGRIWIDPENPNVLVVAALGSVFGPGPDRGIYRTENGGSTWTQVLFVNDRTGGVDLAADPATPQILYAALWETGEKPWLSYFEPKAGSGSGIWKSTDAGKTWTATSRKGLPDSGLSRIGLAVAPGTHAMRVYASVDQPGDQGGMYRSDDGGASWQLINSDSSLSSTYFGRITADITSPDVLFVTGQSVKKTTDAGKTFTIIKGAPGGDDYHFYWINPKHPDHSIVASDQGTAVTVNGGRTWSPWYNQPTGQFYHLSTDNRFPYWIYSAQQDSGTVAIASRSDYGQITFRDWHPVGGDERDFVIPEPDDPDIVYSSGLGGRLSRWDARTGRVTNVAPWPVIKYGVRPTTVKYRYNWITPLAVSPRKPHALYLGAQVLFRSTDRGATWTAISGDLTGTASSKAGCQENVPVEKATACGYGTINSIAPSPAADGLLWVGTDNGRVQLSRNEGKSWEDVTPRQMQDWSKVASVEASPRDPATAYIAVERHRLNDRAPYAYRTHDFGKTWTPITKGIPDGARINVIRQDPVRPELLYAGTRVGVFVSFDDGTTWQPLQLNLPRTAVNDLLIHENDLIAATEGRALWSLDNVTPLRSAHSWNSAAQLAAPAPAYRITNNENRDTPLPPEVPAAPNPPVGAVIDYYLPAAPSSPVQLEILDSAGKVIRTFRSDLAPARPDAERYFAESWIRPWTALPARAGHNRFVWNLRYDRPPSPRYDYSIAATPFGDTPLQPEGIQVPPGSYTIRLTTGETRLQQLLQILKDPRSNATNEGIAAQIRLYNDTAAALAKYIASYKSIAVKDPLFKSPEGMRISEQVSALTGLLIDLEDADGPPTKPQQDVYSQYAAQK